MSTILESIQNFQTSLNNTNTHNAFASATHDAVFNREGIVDGLFCKANNANLDLQVVWSATTDTKEDELGATNIRGILAIRKAPSGHYYSATLNSITTITIPNNPTGGTTVYHFICAIWDFDNPSNTTPKIDIVSGVGNEQDPDLDQLEIDNTGRRYLILCRVAKIGGGAGVGDTLTQAEIITSGNSNTNTNRIIRPISTTYGSSSFRVLTQNDIDNTSFTTGNIAFNSTTNTPQFYDGSQFRNIVTGQRTLFRLGANKAFAISGTTQTWANAIINTDGQTGFNTLSLPANSFKLGNKIVMNCLECDYAFNQNVSPRTVYYRFVLKINNQVVMGQNLWKHFASSSTGSPVSGTLTNGAFAEVEWVAGSNTSAVLRLKNRNFNTGSISPANSNNMWVDISDAFVNNNDIVTISETGSRITGINLSGALTFTIDIYGSQTSSGLSATTTIKQLELSII